ncbi:MAG: extracellular solute-binding protein [Acholeplasmatales bacterium]|nr:extracellular solute-binding protein [Acholeplasmatales bacterium]
MKKIIITFVALILFTIFAVTQISTPQTILYFLNWGEYIDKDLVKSFEEEYNCQIIEEDVTSSEAMYQKIKAGTTSYDVAIPGDYTVRQLYSENLLREIDVKNSKYNNLENYKTMFTDDLQKLIDNNFVTDNNEVYDSYFMPYFWGAYSIIYSTKKSDVESVVENNGFKSLYDRSLYKEDVKIGMYSTARWTVASYLMSEGLNPNITSLNGKDDASDMDKDLQDKLVNGIKNAKFDEWGDDQLKRDVANGTLDMCFTQLGDFFDALYFTYDSGKTEIDMNVSIPNFTSAFFDSMVIPTTCQNYDLANAFINFMMDSDNAYQNAQSIGYCPTLKGVVDAYIADAEDESNYYFEDVLTLKDFLNKYPMYLNPLYGKTDEELEHIQLFNPKSQNYLTTCETIINKAKN